ncbi:sensor domain-containing protein [uncultured Amnibacterium sp.]|uniref:sensor histidine kinase n=1 Tax=uncultured Amnibacterium sp. TaxID=1631851 RepID=UPI0035CC5DF7
MTTATLSTAPPPARHDPAPLGRRYGRMWARTPRELGYLALTALIGLVVATVAWTVVGAGSGFIPLGVLLLIALMLASRYLGAFDLRRLRWAATRPIAEPTWQRPFAGKRPLRAIGDVIADGHYWLYALHSAVVSPALAAVTFTLWSTWLGTALVAATSPIWATITIAGGAPLWVAPGVDARGRTIVGLVLSLSDRGQDPAATGWAIAGVAALGLLMLALLPFITRGLTVAHWGAARLLLGRFASEDLRGEVAKADAARLAAVTAEDSALRRLERDIHDGPQQHLLRLQMELSTAERRLADDREDAAESIATARRLAGETLDELRALAQGFAPPLLQDRGLSAALGALGRRGAVPVETAIAVEGDLPDAVERSVYFIAAELTTNAIKHSGASRIRLEARTTDAPRTLRLTVTDDGRGGAQATPEHGLAGIADRVAGLGGTLTVVSPAGGPTLAEVRVPLA